MPKNFEDVPDLQIEYYDDFLEDALEHPRSAPAGDELTPAEAEERHRDLLDQEGPE